MKKNVAIISIFIICSVVVGGNSALAADLKSAASNANSYITAVVRIMAVTGVVAGAGFMQIPGLAFFGKGVASAGIVGCVYAYGAPALQSLMTTVFGV